MITSNSTQKLNSSLMQNCQEGRDKAYIGGFMMKYILERKSTYSKFLFNSLKSVWKLS